MQEYLGRSHKQSGTIDCLLEVVPKIERSATSPSLLNCVPMSWVQKCWNCRNACNIVIIHIARLSVASEYEDYVLTYTNYIKGFNEFCYSLDWNAPSKSLIAVNRHFNSFVEMQAGISIGLYKETQRVLFAISIINTVHKQIQTMAGCQKANNHHSWPPVIVINNGY